MPHPQRGTAIQLFDRTDVFIEKASDTVKGFFFFFLQSVCLEWFYLTSIHSLPVTNAVK